MSADHIIIGDSLYALCLAQYFQAMGERVLIINPSHRFLEPNPRLRFPDLHTSPSTKDSGVTHKTLAPFIPGETHRYFRMRSWVWLEIKELDPIRFQLDPQIESLIHSSKGRYLDGLALARRMPGFSGESAQGWFGYTLPSIPELFVDQIQWALLDLFYEPGSRVEIWTDSTIYEFQNDRLLITTNSGIKSIRPNKKLWILPTTHPMPTLEKHLAAHGFIKSHKNYTQFRAVSRLPIDITSIGACHNALIWGVVPKNHDPFQNPSWLTDISIQSPSTEQAIQELLILAKRVLIWESIGIRSLASYSHSIFEYQANSSHLPSWVQAITLDTLSLGTWLEWIQSTSFGGSNANPDT